MESEERTNSHAWFPIGGSVVCSGWSVGLATQWSWVRSPAAALSVGWYRDGWPSSGWHTTSVCDQPPGQTRPPALCGTGNEYWPKCGDALRLRGSKSTHRGTWLCSRRRPLPLVRGTVKLVPRLRRISPVLHSYRHSRVYRWQRRCHFRCRPLVGVRGSRLGPM